MSTPTLVWFTSSALLTSTLLTVLTPREGRAQQPPNTVDASLVELPGESVEQTPAMPHLLAVLVPAASAPQSYRAQPPTVRDFCWRPRPLSSCRAFAVTDFGVLRGVTRRGWRSAYSGQSDEWGWKGEIVSDLGVMWNVGSRQAVGATWLLALTYNDSEWFSGPAVRYRQWLKGTQSVDLGLGTLVAPVGDNYGDIRRGSIVSLVKYNPAPWVGFSIRSERLRRSDCVSPVGGSWSTSLVYCGHFGYDSPGHIEPGKDVFPVNATRVLAGIELSDKAGLNINIVWLGLMTLIGLAVGGLN